MNEENKEKVFAVTKYKYWHGYDIADKDKIPASLENIERIGIFKIFNRAWNVFYDEVISTYGVICGPEIHDVSDDSAKDLYKLEKFKGIDLMYLRTYIMEQEGEDIVIITIEEVPVE